MKRREFLGMTLAGRARSCRPAGAEAAAAPHVGMGRRRPRGAALAQGQPLRTLSPLAEREPPSRGHFAATLEAAPREPRPRRRVARPRCGSTTALFPGPVVDVREGERVRIALENRLRDRHDGALARPAGAGRPGRQSDGPRARPAPRASTSSTFPPGTAGTYWYHPHAHGTTAEQVSMGLAAPFIVRAADDPLAQFPRSRCWSPASGSTASGQVSPNGPMDFTVGRQGEQLLVNGGRLPVHTMRPGATQRWRILNATSARYLRLALDGHAFTLVGTDGGLLRRPVGPLAEILVAPGAAGGGGGDRERDAGRAVHPAGASPRHRFDGHGQSTRRRTC